MHSFRAPTYRQRRLSLCLVILLGLAALSIPPQVAHAAFFLITTTADGNDFPACTGLGPCTLRAAISTVNNRVRSDTVVLQPGIYTLTLAGANEDENTSGDLDVAGRVTILGTDPATTIIDANGLDRVFDVMPGAMLTLRGVTLRGGRTPDSSDSTSFRATSGGGIRNSGRLTLDNTVVRQNSTGNTSSEHSSGAVAGSGGGISTLGGTVTLVHSTIISNTTGTGPFAGDGGGIAVLGSAVAISATTIAENSTGIGSLGGGNGGGMSIMTGTVTLENSTISGNTTSLFGDGGGISNSGVVSATNTTISDNSALMGAGGGVANARSGRVTLASVTIAANLASNGGGINNPAGGAERVVRFENTIVASNRVAGNGIGPDCAGALTSAGYNLVIKVSGCLLVGDLVGLMTGRSARLGPLRDNGGTTATRDLRPGSPAIDAGNPEGCQDANGALLATDQRGMARPMGNATTTERCDIGAVEFQKSPIYVYLPLILNASSAD